MEIWNIPSCKDPWICSIQLNRLSAVRPDEGCPRKAAWMKIANRDQMFVFAVAGTYNGVNKILIYEVNVYATNRVRILRVIDTSFNIFCISFSNNQLFALSSSNSLISWNYVSPTQIISEWHHSGNVTTYYVN